MTFVAQGIVWDCGFYNFNEILITRNDSPKIQ